MEKISLVNGNGKKYRIGLPKIIIQMEYINEVALKHILENTGIRFIKNGWGYEGQPKTSKQIVKLFLTYNYKTEYYNNLDTKNTLLLKHNERKRD